MRCRFLLGFIFCFSAFIDTSYAQNDLLNTRIIIDAGTKFQTKKDVLNYISEKYNIVFSYNANLLDDSVPFDLKNDRLTLNELLNEMFIDDQLLIITVIPNKIILQIKGPKQKAINITGRVYDIDSDESIYGAVIYEKLNNLSVLSNEKGYFTISLPPGIGRPPFSQTLTNPGY